MFFFKSLSKSFLIFDQTRSNRDFFLKKSGDIQLFLLYPLFLGIGSIYNTLESK